MIRCGILFLLLLCAAAAKGQSSRHLLQGYVTLPGEPARSYRIYFTVTGNQISGYSITSNPGFGEMKAAITGTVSADGSEFFLKETEELNHNSLLSYGACFFSARLRRTERKGKIYYSGPFDSYMTNGTPCENGVMVLIDKIPEQPAPPPPRRATRPAAPRPRRDSLRTDSIAAPHTPAPDTLRPPAPTHKDTSEHRPLYHWKSETLTFEISDGWDQDGDVVSLYFNDHLLADHIVLSKERKRFSVPLPAEGIGTLRIELHGEGNVPPNTPRLQLIDGSHIYDLSISGKITEKALLYFTRQ